MSTLVEPESPPATSRTARWEAARRRPLLWVSLGVIAVAFGLRVWIIRGPLGSVNADEAVTGLMARALLDGDFSTFYWQQQYGGTVEIIPFAALVAALGDRAAIVVLPLLESLVIGWLLFVVARRRLGGQLALATVALAAVFPAASVWFTTRAMLFYQPVIIAGLGALVLAEQLAEDEVDRRGRAWRWVALGFLLGVGWWASTQVLFFAIPVVVWLVVRRGFRSWRGPVAAVGGFVVGAGPWLVHNLRTEGGSLRDLPGGQGSYVDHLRVQVEAGWPMAVGLRRPFDERWILEGWGWPLAIVAIVAAGAVVVAFARSRRIRSPLALVLVCFPLVHALAPSSYYVGTGRYYLFVMPAIAYAIVAALSTIAARPPVGRRRSGRRDGDDSSGRSTTSARSAPGRCRPRPSPTLCSSATSSTSTPTTGSVTCWPGRTTGSSCRRTSSTVGPTGRRRFELPTTLRTSSTCRRRWNRPGTPTSSRA